MNTLPHQPWNKQPVVALRRWRWLVFAVVLLDALIIELLEHDPLTDPSFWREVIVYGLGISCAIWIVLTLLARQVDYRGKADARFDWWQELNRNLEERLEWTDLTRFVVDFPSTYLPVEHVALFIYDHAQARLQFVSEWNASGMTTLSLDRYQVNATWCYLCGLAEWATVHPLATCSFVTRLKQTTDCAEYCQPLLHDGLLIGIRLLRCRLGSSLSLTQQEHLHSTTAPIALALILALARRAQLEQTRQQAEAEERQRLATELHDSLGQMVSYLHLQLDRLSSDRRLHGLTDVEHDLARLLQVTDKLYDQIRSDLWRLQPWSTPDVGRAIADYVEVIHRHSGLAIQFCAEGQPFALEPKVAYQLFSLVREGLNNIVGHAQAQSAKVELIWATDYLQLQLTDDGVGFDPSVSARPGHYGLRMLRERTLALNGTLLIDSVLGHGTRLAFTLPIAPAVLMPVAARMAELQPVP